VLVDACRLLLDRGVDVECEIVGDGPLRPELDAHIARLALGDRVRLSGPDSEDGVRDRLARADVFALPCVVAADGDRDGIPVALAEAMAMCVPVVSTTLVGIGELVTEGTGLLVEPNDPAALADALSAVAGMSVEQRDQLGRRARRRVQEAFEVETEARRLADLFAAAVAARRQGRAARDRGSERSSVPAATSGPER
jgi:glycosyltransferase involved in cell wall biosynthesis